VQNILSSSLLSKNINIKIYITIILPVVLYGCETLSVTLREQRRLKVSEKRVLNFGRLKYIQLSMECPILGSVRSRHYTKPEMRNITR